MAGHELDDPQVFKRYDPEGMLSHLHHLPQLCRQVWQMTLDFELPPDYGDIDKVLVLGMGGSAIGGDLAASLARAEARLPIIVSRGYELPAFTDAKTLVIASSYSGNTEETMTSFERALKTEAKKLAITTGGKLKAIAQEKGVPVFSFDYQAPPRAALPFSLLPILCFLGRLGLISDKSAALAETVSVLEGLSSRIDETVAYSENPAKKLAGRLHNRLPVVYGAGITAEVARRWKTQINENSKAWAFHEVFPELNHNAVVGYQLPEKLAASIVVVMLRSALLTERIQLRYRVTAKLLERTGVGYQTVDGEGESPLSQMMSLVLFGDYVSYYLALLYQTDPSPVTAIDFLKQQLAEG
ncbi:MAG: bifunctional phosphoglucose/phosphomannose isomerase [Dehalococcoidales bacterium]|nr:bifunctional phosphoglucose/phosphomannose isomerase [Dehalococcoidales bacterium]